MTRSCELCSTTSHDVRPALAWYREGGVKTIDRCDDKAACRGRVELIEEWPLLEADEARRVFGLPWDRR